MNRKKAFLIALAIAAAICAVWALWQRIWVLDQARAVLVLLTDSLTIGGALVLVPGLFLRRPRSERKKKYRHPDSRSNLTEEDWKKAEETRRTLGTGMVQAGGVVLLLALLLGFFYMLMT